MPSALYRTPADLRTVAARIAALPCDKGQVWRVEYRRHRAIRSLPQNSLLWKWYGVIAAETGQPADDIHEWCKRKFLPPREVVLGGTRATLPGSTRGLDTAGMTRYLDCVRLWASEELGIVLPSPGEQGFDDMAAAYGY